MSIPKPEFYDEKGEKFEYPEIEIIDMPEEKLDEDKEKILKIKEEEPDIGTKVLTRKEKRAGDYKDI